MSGWLGGQRSVIADPALLSPCLGQPVKDTALTAEKVSVR